jgi:hypothetical protein
MDAAGFQTVGVNRPKVLTACDEDDFVSGPREKPAEISAHSACSNDRDLHARSSFRDGLRRHAQR